MMRSPFKLFLPLLLLASCSLSEKVATDGVFQKRKYRSGWHVSFSEGHKAPLKVSAQAKEFPVASKELPPVKMPRPEVEELGSPVQKAPSSQYKADSCDLITKRNGEKIRAKVENASGDKIRYRDCDRPEGPVYIIEKSSVSRIVYAEGGKLSLHNEEKGGGDEARKEKDDSPDFKDATGLLFAIAAAVYFLIGGSLWVSGSVALLAFILCYPGDNKVGVIGMSLSGLILLVALFFLGGLALV